MSAATSFSRLPGFRDFVPEDLALRSHVFGTWRRVARSYGFGEYDGPPLEPLGLYVEKSGEEIVGQLYAFTDKGGREVALRPEMTPTLARMLAERSRGMPKPIRWFSIPQLFRYERSQRGRLREHFQLNVDIVGESGVAADAEVLAVAVDAVRCLGLGEDDFVARVNDRRLVSAVLTAAGVPAGAHAGCLAVIDKAGRAGPERTRAGLDALGLSPGVVEVLAELIADGSPEHLAERFRDTPRVMDAMRPLQEHRSILEAMGLGGFLHFDLTVVRGLAYYTGIVFELFDRAGELRAICGGGRYDRLLELVGGEPLPAVGFGMGDVVLGELLRDRGLVPGSAPSCDYYVVWVGPDQRAAGLEIGSRLRAAGHSVMYSLRPQGVGKQLKAANRAGAQRAVIIGPDEAAAASATVRDLATGSQETKTLRSLLERETKTPPAGRNP
ncbi:MAG: histidine--tRNA ligase [Gemmatimonadetes bacterium]|nr:histidine--tRNA ligase [Gemmatimonadota bacterium]MYH53375.1 histidine--tRNA ligase [Gemmatimonadota bacterium]MYK65862.1 histidine--tRNA ligase [Gemmatimonadota bacterium]